MHPLFIISALALSIWTPAAAAAPVEVTASSPAAGAEVKAPKTIALTFSEPVDTSTAAASIVMTAMPGVQNHGDMVIRNFTTSWSDDGKTMLLALRKPLPVGTYEVRWQAAGPDGSAINGTITFDAN